MFQTGNNGDLKFSADTISENKKIRFVNLEINERRFFMQYVTLNNGVKNAAAWIWRLSDYGFG